MPWRPQRFPRVRRTLPERVFESRRLLVIAICGVWLLAGHLGEFVRHLLRWFAGGYEAGRIDPVEPYTVDVARTSAASAAKWLLLHDAWAGALMVLPAVALCVWFSRELRRDDLRAVSRRMGWVRPRREELVLLGVALPAILVLAWRYGVRWSNLRELALPALVTSVASALITFGFCFLALRGSPASRSGGPSSRCSPRVSACCSSSKR
ncbi:MAG: hypothetical protein R3F34_20000 [Planctomycetota bacterium]